MFTTQFFRTDSGRSYFPEKGILLFVLVASLFSGALALRLHNINKPPLDFAPTRQYRSAVLAQMIYQGEDVAGFRNGILEPLVNEYIAAGVYGIIGQESLTAARVLSVSYWMLGAVFLYLLARQAISNDGAVAAFTFFLYLPYGVSASRSFQPDSLMIMLFIGAVWAIFMLRQAPLFRWWAAAVVFSALAIYVKPVCVFPIWLSFLATGMYRKGLKATVFEVSSILYYLFSFLPSLIYYGNGLFIDGFLKAQANGSFKPHMIFTEFYWKGWLTNVVTVFSAGVIVVALLGIPLIRSRLGKWLLVGLAIGYVVFGLVFSFHICTHVYYQLPLIPIVALGVAVVAAVVLKRMAKTNAFWRWSTFAVMVFALLISAKSTQRRLHVNAPHLYAELRKEIGIKVGHSKQTVFLAGGYGNPLRYYGKVEGIAWPHVCDMNTARLRCPNTPPPPRGKTLLEKMVATYSPEYFIITDMNDFSKQPDLKQALDEHQIIYSNNQSVIYDLRAKASADEVMAGLNDSSQR